MAREVSTGNNLHYQFNPVSSGSIHFKVKAAHDAHLALTSGRAESLPMYEIMLGGWKNTRSVIRKNKQKPDKAVAETNNLLSATAYRGFWIRWAGSCITVGREGEVVPFLAWTDPEPFGIGYYGICTGWGATGSWRLEEFTTENKLQYHFNPVTPGSLQFKVRANHDAHIALTPVRSECDPMYEIIIGGWSNTKSAIRKNKQTTPKAETETRNILSGTEYRGFWIRWARGSISVGREREVAPFIVWKDPQPLNVAYYGICTGWGASGSWLLQEFTTEDKLQYHFNPVSRGSLHFKVRAPNDAHIALTSGPHESEPMYEIMIGGWGNTKSVIRRNKQKPDKAETVIHNILSGAEYRGFWISWGGGSITVGRKGELSPFVSWNDPEPFGIGYYGICTGWGASGSWLIEASTQGWSIPIAPPTGCTACWVDAKGGHVPPGAVPAGMQQYVGRAQHAGALIPGKVIPAHGVCYVAWGGLEHRKSIYQVLTRCKAAWIPASGGALPVGALPSGTSETGETLFVGRASHNGVLTVGKVQPSHCVCYIPYGGQEIGYLHYEVLVAK